MNENGETLDRLHALLLQMMSEIDILCRKHNITYYLNGGNALGAVRHGGFIPWDDDMDVMMHTKDYNKFLEICRSELDQNQWFIQEAWKDWPGCFSKLRLKNTYIEDVGEWDGIKKEHRGIFIDIFEIVNSPSSKFLRFGQYCAAKLLIAYSLLNRGYKTKSKIKKIVIKISSLLRYKFLFKFIKSNVYKYNKSMTSKVAIFFGMARFHSAFYEKDVFGKPAYLNYETLRLPLPTDYDFYLRNTFGDYMILPPKEQQKPVHALNINFGTYSV